MKPRILIFVFALCGIINLNRAQIVYNLSSCGYAPIGGAGTALPLGDDIMSGMIPIGFTFQFYGTSYTTCDVSSNGFLTFNAGMGSGCCSGQLMPAAGWPTMIAWSWDDMYTIGGNVNYFTSGVAPNRIFVLNYNSVGYCCSPANQATVQIQLYETTNEIRILSANNNHAGRTSTMGVQSIGNGNTVVPGRNSTSWTSGANECYSFLPVIPPPPVNDNPCGAIALPVNAACSYTVTTNIAATNTATVAAPPCASYAGGDVWYTAVVPASGNIVFDTQGGGMTNSGMAVYSGAACAGPFTLIACDDNSSTNPNMSRISLAGQTPGATLWIRVWSFNNASNGSFNICAFSPPPPPNDNPCGATALTVNPGCTYMATTNLGATATAGVPAPGCASYTGGDVWFSAVVPATGNITFDTQQGFNTNSGMAVYSGASCAGPFTLIACDDNSSGNLNMSNIALTGQTPGATLWIRVWSFNNATNGTFNICAYSPPPPLCYNIGAIAYAPDAPGGTSLVLSDDQYSPVVNIGFNFCVGGTTYSQLLISSNGYVDFDLASASGGSSWSIAGPIPTNSPPDIMTTIMAPWQDLYPPSGGTITYQTLGVAPNRRFVVSWTNVPMFSCTGLLHTGQLKLFETSNCIEVHLGNKQLCAGWNTGQAIEGINNWNGTSASVVAGRNAPVNWSATNNAHRLAPTCVPCSTATTCIVPLPVELNYANVNCENGTVNVSWSTASEINNDYFVVERSADGISYEEIARTDGSGNSNQHQSYSYVDQTPIDGIGYYRLKQVDYDGDFKLYDPMTVNCAPTQISLYPNPTHGDFKIIGVFENDDITVSDPTGNILLKTKASGNLHKMSLGHLGAGVYFVTIIHNSNTIVRKLVID